MSETFGMLGLVLWGLGTGAFLVSWDLLCKSCKHRPTHANTNIDLKSTWNGDSNRSGFGIRCTIMLHMKQQLLSQIT